MNYIIVILITLLVIKIMQLEKRIVQLECHEPSHQHKSVLVAQHASNLHDYASQVYVINDQMLKRK